MLQTTQTNGEKPLALCSLFNCVSSFQNITIASAPMACPASAPRVSLVGDFRPVFTALSDCKQHKDNGEKQLWSFSSVVFTMATPPIFGQQADVAVSCCYLGMKLAVVKGGRRHPSRRRRWTCRLRHPSSKQPKSTTAHSGHKVVPQTAPIYRGHNCPPHCAPSCLITCACKQLRNWAQRHHDLRTRQLFQQDCSTGTNRAVPFANSACVHTNEVPKTSTISVSVHVRRTSHRKTNGSYNQWRRNNEPLP